MKAPNRGILNSEAPINTEMEEFIMNHKTPNPDIGCTVRSCAYHCEDQNHCSLNAITVEACPGCGTGIAKDESMCASYRHK